MKVAYSTSCFSNDSDYYSCVYMLSGKQLKERRLLNWSRLIRWCVSETDCEWQLICIQCRQCFLYGMFVTLYISDRICSLLHTCSVCFVIIKNCFVVAASYPCFVGIRNTVTHFSELRGNITHFQNELKETLIFIHYHHHDRSFVFHFDLHYKLTDTV